MNTMWYLQSHAVWLKLSNLSIVALPFVCLAAHEGSVYDGQPLKCQTSTATPAEPGGLPWGSKYSPAGPGAIAFVTRLKRLQGVANASPLVLSLLQRQQQHSVTWPNLLS